MDWGRCSDPTKGCVNQKEGYRLQGFPKGKFHKHQINEIKNTVFHLLIVYYIQAYYCKQCLHL